MGDLIEFDVYEDFKQHDSILVPKGSKVYAKILETANAKIPLEGVIDFARKNHTSGAVIAGAVVAAPLIFLTGQHAKIPKDYKTVATVKTDTEL